MEHGGDWAGFEEEYGTLPLDCSANVSPLGLPEGVRRAVAEALHTAERYPDPLCRELCAAIGARERVPADWCLCGNGAADLIYRAVRAIGPKRALVTAPTFSEYQAALDTVGCITETWRLSEESGFRLEEGVLGAITSETDVMFLCEPNNPTGITSDRSLLERVCDRCVETDTWLVLDECFLDFVERPEAHTQTGRLADMPKLVIVKSFTKMYAMAGLRLGYCLCSNPGMLTAMRREGPPWAVSSLAQRAGIAALKENDYVQRVRNLIATERRRMLRSLRDMGVATIDGEANYLLFRSREGLAEQLRERGILIRNCASFDGLDGHWYRIAVQGTQQNDRLLWTLREVLK